MPPCSWMASLTTATALPVATAWASHTARAASGALGQRPRRAVDRRAGVLHGDKHVGQPMLDGLEGADGETELVSFGGVARGRVQRVERLRRRPLRRPVCATVHRDGGVV